MQKLRLAILGASPCSGCSANCCRQNGHEFAVLLEGDERRKFAAFSRSVTINGTTGLTSERVLPYRNGCCVFLGEDRQCTIYDDRPVNCRRFECVSGYHLGGTNLAEHSLFLQRNPDVLLRLEVL